MTLSLKSKAGADGETVFSIWDAPGPNGRKNPSQHEETWGKVLEGKEGEGW